MALFYFFRLMGIYISILYTYKIIGEISRLAAKDISVGRTGYVS